jgi:hypothetical protein
MRKVNEKSNGSDVSVVVMCICKCGCSSRKPRLQAAVKIVNNVEKKKDKSFLDTVLLITSVAIGV